MLSIFTYNVWMLANVVLADSLEIELRRTVMKLSRLAKFFSVWIKQTGDPRESLAELLRIS